MILVSVILVITKAINYVSGILRFELNASINNDVIQDCCNFLKFSLPSDLLATRYATFSNRYTLYKNVHRYFGLKLIDFTLL